MEKNYISLSGGPKSLETSKEAQKLRKWWYRYTWEAKQRGWHVAWCMGVMPTELLLAMEVAPIFPENYGPICSAKQVAQPFIELAESEGFSRDICAYARINIGYVIKRRELGHIPPEAPYGGIPDPDMLLAPSMTCDVRVKWFQTLARYLEAPYLLYDHQIPPNEINCRDRYVFTRYVSYYLEQIKKLVAFIETRTGKKLDREKLIEYINIAQETRFLWHETQELRKAIPSPMGAEDYFTCMNPQYWMAGTLEAREFHRKLRDEVKERVNKKLGVIPVEKHRLMWGGFPQWFNVGLLTYVHKFGAVFVIEDKYHNPKPVEVHTGDPLRDLAEIMYWAFAGDPYRSGRIDSYKSYIQEYAVDGLVMHQARSCNTATIGMLHLKNTIRDRFKIPTIYLESDLGDVRDYSEAEFKKIIDAFMEIFKESKKTA